MEKRRILVIAGSDSSGGAGLEADQKVIAAHGCYAMTATTALTAQNTLGVSAIHHIPPDFVVKQIDACIEDIGVDIVKIGMLASAETVDAVASALRRHDPPTIILDPVMVSTSGSQLLPTAAIHNLLTSLLPQTTLLTPNIPEALLLLQHSLSQSHHHQDPQEDPRSKHQEPPQEEPPPTFLPALISLTKRLHALGPKYILLKGGHLPLTRDHEVAKTEAEREIVVNIFYDGTTDAVVLETGYLQSRNTHGTGCSLASAISSQLALRLANNAPSSSPRLQTDTLLASIKTACRYIEAGIRSAQGCEMGKGKGPIDHFCWSRWVGESG